MEEGPVETLPFALSFIEWLSKKAGTEGGGQPINLKVGASTESGFTATLKTDGTEGICQLSLLSFTRLLIFRQKQQVTFAHCIK